LLDRKLQLHLGDDSHTTTYGVPKYMVDITDHKKNVVKFLYLIVMVTNENCGYKL